MVESLANNRERLQRLRRERPEWNRAKNAAWKAANPEKYRAHKAVENAIKAGTLQREPCERCGVTERVHAHHDDYAKPREVRWLCPTHHRERHREMEAEHAGPSSSPTTLRDMVA